MASLDSVLKSRDITLPTKICIVKAMVGRHPRLNGHEFEQAPGDGEGQGSLAFFNPWHCKELDMTEQLN